MTPTKWSEEAKDLFIAVCIIVPAMILAAIVGVWTDWTLTDALGWLVW